MGAAANIVPPHRICSLERATQKNYVANVANSWNSDGKSVTADADTQRQTPPRLEMNPQDRIHRGPQDGLDRRSAGSNDSRDALVDALARCRSELETRVPDALTGEFSVGALNILREPVAAFAAVASREKLPPERALVMFKKMIGQLADIERCPLEQREVVHRQLVEMAIESYFTQQKPPAAG
jgi:hypothetical protein